ncbi:MAG: PKD domain-containing protein [Planctomycetota bacterium]
MMPRPGLLAAVCLAAGLAPPGRSAETTVTLDPSVSHQTIRGWSCNAHYILGSKEQREQVIDDAVNLLGLTRMRWQQPNGILTVYPHPGGNLPPVVTDWEARPHHLRTPASQVTLAAEAQDPERDALSYAWAVANQPNRARAALADPTAATTQATGLSAPGLYTFTVTVSDGADQVARQVLLNVFEGNQPPLLLDVHNRIPVLVTLPHDNTLLIGGVRDLEGDKPSFRWSVVKQPQGGCETKVDGLSVAGVYVFTLTVVDRTKVARDDVTVVVHPKGGPPPVTQGDPAPARAKGGRTIARGVVTGTMTRKGKAWVEVRSASGKTTRFIPHWRGGMPRDGGGPEKATVRAIAALKVGQRVSIRWSVDHHVRIETIQPAP